jgi:hypothetical protein
MPLNEMTLTESRWRRLHADVRAEFRQDLGGKQAIVDHQVLDVTRALCRSGAYGLALTFYETLCGDPLSELAVRLGRADDAA